MSTDAHSTGSHHEHYVVPLKNYVINACALAVLMALTVAASEINLGPFNAAVAIGIAITKAVLIVLFFMNTWYNTRLTWVFVVMSFFWLFILIGMFLPDYFARDFATQPNAWASAPAAQLEVLPERQLPMDKRVIVPGEGHGGGH
ncbi:MAG: oxidase [Candidatus Hydrogenedentes bacterium]|nr:oxidase [Candidatus Hydrogenedentota bacterium]